MKQVFRPSVKESRLKWKKEQEEMGRLFLVLGMGS